MARVGYLAGHDLRARLARDGRGARIELFLSDRECGLRILAIHHHLGCTIEQTALLAARRAVSSAAGATQLAAERIAVRADGEVGAGRGGLAASLVVGRLLLAAG